MDYHPRQKMFIISNINLLLTTNRHIASFSKVGGGGEERFTKKKRDSHNVKHKKNLRRQSA